MAKDKNPPAPANEQNIGKPGAPQGQGPQNNGQPGMQVVKQYIKDLSFENPNAPESLVTGWPQPDTNIQVSLQTLSLKEELHECTLKFRIEAKKKDDGRTCFLMDLTYCALVVLQNIPEDQHRPVLMVEVPKLLFPFVREIVATATANGGYPPLYLTPISFEAMYINEMKRLKEEQAGKAAV